MPPKHSLSRRPSQKTTRSGGSRLLCYGGAGLVGYARIEQNAHYASDVVAGSLLGWSVARAVVHRHNGPPNPKKLSWSLYADGDGARLVFFKSF